ncbi:hypothetical protein [Holdemanella biformis]|uniref:hypothetical protein n=1 Tax=Holdemanella biformis TaxID=1735 RepID=UPI0022E179BC|nr:hypothetical protein [Holdemanella biformis]
MNKYQKAIEVIDTLLHLMCGEEREDGYEPTMEEMSNSMDLLKNLANKAESFEWIPFTFDEEGVLNCELPDVDEEILVSDGDSVWQDTWCEADEGYELFSGIEIEDLAWRQLPKPYEENQNENNC